MHTFSRLLASALAWANVATATPSPSLTTYFAPDLGSPVRCRATPVRREKNRCVFLTAAHCLVALGEGDVRGTARWDGAPPVKVERFVVKGSPDALATDDIGVFQIASGCERKEFAPVPFLSAPLGTVRGDGSATPVLVAAGPDGVLAPAILRPHGSKGATTDNYVIDLGGNKAFRGNSGGGIFLRDEDSGKLEIIGVIAMAVLPVGATGEEDGFTLFYANRAVGWAEERADDLLAMARDVASKGLKR